MRRFCALSLLVAIGFAGLFACSSDSSSPAGATGAPDATVADTGAGQGDASGSEGGNRQDASTADGGLDARPDGCPALVTQFDAGDTCAGFGTGGACNTACGLPQYGYVCIGGGPPNLTGCVRASDSIVGGTYCCPTLSCVRSSFQDTSCADAGGHPHFFQCATDTDGGLLVQPPAACVPSTGPAPYKYYCCP